MQACDLAVVGSGFGGSLLSMIAARLGLRVILIERGRHPRFAIGESASPLAGILIEQLADRYDLPRVRPLSAFGTWQRACADVVCGLKRGFTYYRHELATAYRPAADRRNQLLVAASPSDELSDTHWLRADVDHFLLREAIAVGVDYIDEVELDDVAWGSDCQTLGGRRHGRRLHVAARFVVDASGPRGFLSRVLRIDNEAFADYPRTQALFSHFAGVARCDAMPDYASDERPPYPPDDAALHHIFDGGWMWVLRFGNGVTSAGVAVTDSLAAELRLADGRPAWDRLLGRYPTIAAQFAGSEAIREFTWMPQLAWRVPAAAGEGWAMLPSAAAFVDPLFSTGIPLTLLGVERIARALADSPTAPPLAGYAATTLAEADHTARFIAGCYAAFPHFDVFSAYSMFYFASASFSEMARRVARPRHDARFLGADHRRFAEAIIRLSPRYAAPGEDYLMEVAGAIDPLNIAGLCDPAKCNWYAIDFDDAIRAADKLEVEPDVVARAVRRAGRAQRQARTEATEDRGSQ
jgi:tetracycline 7-halogenase / FADH2 O2-dependent halogenase